MKKKLLAITLCGIVFITGCGTKVKLKDGEEVVASLKDKQFTAEELFDVLKEKYGSTVLTDMVDSYIINKEIPKDKDYEESAKAQLASTKAYYEQYNYSWDTVLNYYGFKNDEEFLTSAIESAKREDIITNYLKKEITDDEIQKYYDEEIYGNYTVKHILIKPETAQDMTDDEKTEANENAKKKAEEAIEKLNDGASWSDVVKEYSDDDQTKEEDGVLPAFTNGDYVDSFFKATIALENESYTKEPVESTYGYHIIYRVSATDKPSLEDAKETCLEKIAANKLNNDANLAMDTWIKIREDYELSIADTTINENYKKSLNAKEES